MKTCSYCRIDRPESEFRPGWHKCKICYRAEDVARKAAYYQANKDAFAARNAAYCQDNRDTIAARKAAYRIANRGVIVAREAAYRAANKGVIAARKVAHRAANKEIYMDSNVRRRKCKRGQTPLWADKNKIREIYRDAAEFRAAGLDVHVDHIIPLRAKLASGLHVHQNLTIKLAKWNDSKGNKLDV